jgi:N-acetylmuramoyl-L-alanine amidase
MQSPANPPVPASTPSPKSVRGTFYLLQIVLGVAFVVATLFTAWTPGIFAPINPSQRDPSSLVLQPTSALSENTTATPRARPLIGIVSGHWGNDSGAVCADGLTEVEINQNIATLVQKYLVDQGFDVDLLHEFDERLNGYQASALVSIHADSCDYINDQATGYKVASAMASPNRERAARLTACLRSRYGQITGQPLHSTSVTNDMTSYHAFGEISETTTAAIIETGFLNLDRQFLIDHPDLAAQGISSGILCFINNESITISPTPTPMP